MPDSDVTVLDDAARSVAAIDARYRAADFNEKIELKPHVDAAFSAYSAARLNLLADGVVSSDADVGEMGDLKRKVTAAADTQSLIAAIVKLVAFLAKFA